MSFQTVITYDSASQFSFDSTLIELSGGLLRLKDLGGATYSTANPTIETQHRISMSSITSFANTISAAAGSNVKYQIIIGDTAYWYDTVNLVWSAASGYAQSNTGAEVTANIGAMLAGLSITQSFFLRVRVYLNSNGTVRPSVTTNTWVYGMTYQTPTTIATCLITGYLSDLLGAAYTIDSTKPATLYVKSDRSFMHGNQVIRPFAKSANFDSNGLVSLSVIQTETISQNLEFFITFYEGSYLKTARMKPAFVPNASARTLNQISSVTNVDVG